ncbi:MAG TPA: copper chaperone PCu(A)C [Aestuariivirga sp.]|nr:copper chaperone PCu(A)C [Aestuariivirga sp.]
MRKPVLEILAAIALTLGAILASTPGVLANDVMVKDAFARASAVPTAKAGAVYMTLSNQGAASDRLLQITTEGAASAAVHESAEKDGVATMRPVEGLEIPASGSVELKPGGYHIMLMGLKAPLKKGDMIMLQLKFEHAGLVDVMAHVGDVAEEHAHTGGAAGN